MFGSGLHGIDGLVDRVEDGVADEVFGVVSFVSVAGGSDWKTSCASAIRSLIPADVMASMSVGPCSVGCCSSAKMGMEQVSTSATFSPASWFDLRLRRLTFDFVEEADDDELLLDDDDEQLESDSEPESESLEEEESDDGLLCRSLQWERERDKRQF